MKRIILSIALTMCAFGAFAANSVVEEEKSAVAAPVAAVTETQATEALGQFPLSVVTSCGYTFTFDYSCPGCSMQDVLNDAMILADWAESFCTLIAD